MIDLGDAYKKGSTFPDETVKWYIYYTKKNETLKIEIKLIFFTLRQEKYGPVYKIQIFTTMMVFVAEPSVVKVIK